MYRDIPEGLRELIEPVANGAGFDLVDVIVTRGRQPWSVKVILDTREGDGKVSVEGCADVAREVVSNFDAGDTIPVAYRLEVTSPGLDRVLAREKDFIAACGTEIKLQTREPLDGRRRFRGTLVKFDSGIARLDIEGHQVEIPFGDVASANVVYKFTRADFARGATSS